MQKIDSEAETTILMEMDRLSRRLMQDANGSTDKLLAMHHRTMRLMAQRIAQLNVSLQGREDEFAIAPERLTMEILVVSAIIESGRWEAGAAMELAGTIVDTILFPERDHDKET